MTYLSNIKEWTNMTNGKELIQRMTHKEEDTYSPENSLDVKCWDRVL